MKKFKLFLIGAIILSSIFAGPVYAAKNPYKQTNNLMGTPLTNCTWYAWDQAYRKAGVALPGWGNAATWYESARKAGFEVGSVPKAKSIVVWSWTWNGKNYGHVGYVESVKGDSIYVWDSDKSCINQEDPDYKKCISESPSQEGDEACIKQYAKNTACKYSSTYWSSPGDLIGYIYLDSAPKTTTANKTTTSKVTTKKTTTAEIKKSDNRYLSDIRLSVGEIEFDKDIDEYEIDVENDVQSIRIEAKTEDKNAKVDIKDEYILDEGTNEIELVVTAEDGTKAAYLIKVNRKEKANEVFANVQQTEEKNDEKKNSYIYVVLSISAGLASILIITLAIIKRKKKR